MAVATAPGWDSEWTASFRDMWLKQQYLQQENSLHGQYQERDILQQQQLHDVVAFNNHDGSFSLLGHSRSLNLGSSRSGATVVQSLSLKDMCSRADQLHCLDASGFFLPLPGGRGTPFSQPSAGLGLAFNMPACLEDENPSPGVNKVVEDMTLPGGQMRIGDHLPLLEGRFRYLESLSEGGSAKVFTAIDLLDPAGRTVVIKAMHRHYREVGLQEQQLLCYLNALDPEDCCHIVRLISGFDFCGHTCLVLERLQGTLLEHMCSAERQALQSRDLVEEIRRLALHLLVALSTLHSTGVIHGDLKPENILLQGSGAKTGASAGVKLADFGNSFTPDQIKGLCRDFNVQTLAYRSPEVLLGLPFDARIDMWSLGCIVAELAIGRLLFACDRPSQLLQQMASMLGAAPPMCLFGHGKFYSSLFEEAGLSPQDQALSMGSATLQSQGRPMRYDFCTPGRSYLGDFLLEVDAQLADLVCGLLQFDPSCRLTAREALLHPFFSPLFRAQAGPLFYEQSSQQILSVGQSVAHDWAGAQATLAEDGRAARVADLVTARGCALSSFSLGPAALPLGPPPAVQQHPGKPEGVVSGSQEQQTLQWWNLYYGTSEHMGYAAGPASAQRLTVPQSMKVSCSGRDENASGACGEKASSLAYAALNLRGVRAVEQQSFASQGSSAYGDVVSEGHPGMPVRLDVADASPGTLHPVTPCTPAASTPGPTARRQWECLPGAGGGYARAEPKGMEALTLQRKQEALLKLEVAEALQLGVGNAPSSGHLATLTPVCADISFPGLRSFAESQGCLAASSSAPDCPLTPFRDVEEERARVPWPRTAKVHAGDQSWGEGGRNQTGRALAEVTSCVPGGPYPADFGKGMQDPSGHGTLVQVPLHGGPQMGDQWNFQQLPTGDHRPGEYGFHGRSSSQEGLLPQEHLQWLLSASHAYSLSCHGAGTEVPLPSWRTGRHVSSRDGHPPNASVLPQYGTFSASCHNHIQKVQGGPWPSEAAVL